MRSSRYRSVSSLVDRSRSCVSSVGTALLWFGAETCVGSVLASCRAEVHSGENTVRPGRCPRSTAVLTFVLRVGELFGNHNVCYLVSRRMRLDTCDKRKRKSTQTHHAHKPAYCTSGRWLPYVPCTVCWYKALHAHAQWRSTAFLYLRTESQQTRLSDYVWTLSHHTDQRRRGARPGRGERKPKRQPPSSYDDTLIKIMNRTLLSCGLASDRTKRRPDLHCTLSLAPGHACHPHPHRVAQSSQKTEHIQSNLLTRRIQYRDLPRWSPVIRY